MRVGVDLAGHGGDDVVLRCHTRQLEARGGGGWRQLPLAVEVI